MADFPLGEIARTFTSDIGSVSAGVVVASSTTAHTVGLWVPLDAVTEFDACAMTIQLLAPSGGSGPIPFLINIAIGGAGVEETIIPNILAEFDDALAEFGPCSMRVPINIPAGSRISANCQTESTNADAVSILVTFEIPTFASYTGLSHVITYGANTSATGGVVIDPGGTVNTKGSWVPITTSSDQLSGLSLSTGHNSNTAVATGNFLFDISIGTSGNENDGIILLDIPMQMNAFERSWLDRNFYRVDIPDGSRISVRSQSTINQATDRLIDVCVHGVR